MNDQELQERVEKGSTPASEDGRLYHTLFEALRREPAYTLPHGFADRVVTAVRDKYTSRDMPWLVAGVTLFVIVLIIATIVTDFSMSIGVFTFLSSYAGLVTFAVLFILALQWIDRTWIRKPLPQ